ncbi:hypothetical protein QYE76_009327 [Lolium multiflorum]|uniref:Prolamin n=1 Tax=Lolium multiflorum TaxID=4521 RepID=A0AAD8X1Y7_LOLMU|nr:hypothetical protein QYE76_009327 [Lolium multiflorum]
MVPFLRSQILQQSSCEVMRQQCCQLLVQIPKQLQYPAIYSIVNSGFSMQQQQQLPQPHEKQVGQGLCQPQPQQAGQGFIQVHDLAKFEAMRNFALQTLPAMCKVAALGVLGLPTAPASPLFAPGLNQYGSN